MGETAEVAKEWDADAAMEFIEDAVREAISEYFGRETDPSKRIEKYGGLIAEIRGTASALKSRRGLKM